jgi:hypothetical protein
MFKYAMFFVFTITSITLRGDGHQVKELSLFLHFFSWGQGDGRVLNNLDIYNSILLIFELYLAFMVNRWLKFVVFSSQIECL